MSVVAETDLTSFEMLAATLRQRVQDELAALLGVAPDTLSPSERFNHFGIDSARAATLIARLATWLDRPLSPTLVWEYPTIQSLSAHLAGGAGSGREGSEGGSPERRGAALDEPIAIVGIACRFPGGASSAERFWELLRNGVDAIREVPKDRWDIDAYHDEDPAAPGKMNTRRGAFLEQIDAFDPLFFGISPREAVQMDPQQRLMLELSLEALEDAGVVPSSLRQSRTGVFFGLLFRDYELLQSSQTGVGGMNAYTSTGNAACILSNRVSYALDLQGPSLTVDTACSSSLVAVHLACQSLRSGECSVALAGGVNLMIIPGTTVALAKLGVLSPDGRCKAFDARANGYVRGEGGGVVILKRLSAALKDGNSIYCIIRGSAVNNDGASNGLTAPNPKAQQAVLQAACQDAQAEPRSIQYVEAHGTGTPLGDPIEAISLSAVYGRDRLAEQPLLLGSVKTNIGHLEPAAGVAGLIKVALSLHHGALPPSLHFEQPNPHIDFEALRVQVVSELRPWPALPEAPRRAGVSSFGYGGTNAHVIVEGLPRPKRLLLLSGESPDALRASVQRTVDTLARDEGEGEGELLWQARASIRAPHGSHRLAFTLESAADFKRQAEEVLAGRHPVGVFHGVRERPRSAVWVFSGQGSQRIGMGAGLLAEEPVFRAALERCDRAMRPHLGWSIVDALSGSAGRVELGRMDVAWPLLFAIQVALADLWRASGIEPAAVIGHSLGEVSAACVAGVLTLEDGARIVCHQAELVQRASGRGAMALVALSADEAERRIALHGGRVSMAIAASPVSTVLAGERALLEELLAQLQREGVFARWIETSAAVHSPAVGHVAEELPPRIEGIRPKATRVPLVSTVTGGFVRGEELDVTYWSRQLLLPVQFAQGIRALFDQGHEVFLELSPHPVVQRSIEKCAASAGVSAVALASLLRGEPEGSTMRAAHGALFAHGVSVGEESRGPGDNGAEGPIFLLPVSARVEPALLAAAHQMSERLRRADDIAVSDVCYTASVLRAAHEHRSVALGRTKAELADALEAIAEGREHPSAMVGAVFAGAPPKIAFLFTGQGSQYAGMGRELYATQPVFRGALDRCAEVLDPLLDRPLLSILQPAAGEPHVVGETAFAQPALFALEYALTQLWRAWGVEPDALLGHSVGELTAACIAGVMTLEDGARLVAARGRLMQALPRNGAMIAIRTDLARVEAALAPCAGRVAIAAVNGPSSVVISGEAQAVRAIADRLAAEGVWTKELAVSHAFHSPLMAPMLDAFEAEVQKVKMSPPRLPLITNLSGGLASDEITSPGYWRRQILQPVRFAEGVATLAAQGCEVFLEIGPHPTLLGLAMTCLPEDKYTWLPSLRRDHRDWQVLLESLGRLYVRGLGVRWEGFHAPHPRRRVSLPAYPFQRERYWIATTDGSGAHGVEPTSHTDPGVAGKPLGARGTPPATPASTEIIERLRRAPEGQRLGQLRALITDEISRTLQLKSLPRRSGFFELGMDSLMAVEVSKRLSALVGWALPATLVFDHPTVEALTTYLAKELSLLDGPARGAKAAGAAALVRERSSNEPIAIIGMACRFPGGSNDPEAFWELLRSGGDAVRAVPPERWDIDAYYDPDPDAPGKTCVRTGAFLDDVAGFDAAFFNIAPREVRTMDPQQRLLLETSWEALEYAGYAPDAMRGSRTGVFVGFTNSDYTQILMRSTAAGSDPHVMTGYLPSLAAGRLSYVFGFQGPSATIDTACSSSLVAVHLACQSLRLGESDVALAGGVSLMLTPEPLIALSRMRALAPDGRCKTFDARADGYARGEGCGMVLLKRLSEALADQDNILAVIRGSAVNQDGASGGLTVPNGVAQEKLIQQAVSAAGIEPAQVGYVEAHGTGTSLGDPIEVRALLAVLGAGRPKDRPFLLGSLKTNIGHLEPAAGIAGLMKLVLSLQHREIPPHLHLETPNQHIPWDEVPATIPTELSSWPAIDDRRIAGLSSFGISGTNAHAIVEEAPRADRPPVREEPPAQLFLVSAKTKEALDILLDRYASRLAAEDAPPLTDLCYTAATGRSHFAHRIGLVTESPARLREQLRGVKTGEEIAGLVQGTADLASPPKIAFLFTGAGAQYVNMGEEVYRTQPVFRDALEQCDALLRPYLQRPLLSVIFPAPGETSPIDEIEYTQPVTMAFQYALAMLWRSWGIEPSAVAGHSTGELAAACVAGALPLASGLKLIAERGRLMQTTSRDGEMVAINADEARVTAAIAPHAGEVFIAAINSPEDVVISGTARATRAVAAAFDVQGIKTKRLVISVTAHSPVVDPILDDFERAAADVSYREPHTAVISSLLGRRVDGAELAEPSYWRRHLREPVRFLEAMGALRQEGIDIFIEIGPSPVLLDMGRRCWPAGEGVWLPSLRKARRDLQQILESLGVLYTRGADADWGSLYRGRSCRRVVLPTYPFQRKRYWVEEAKVERRRVPAAGNGGPTTPPGLLGARMRTALPLFEAEVQGDALPFERGRTVEGLTVLPPATAVEMAMAAAAEVHGTLPSGLSDLRIHDVLVLPAEGTRTVQSALMSEGSDAARVQIHGSAAEEGPGGFHLLATATVHTGKTAPATPAPLPLEDVRARCRPTAVNGSSKTRAPHVEALWIGEGEALARIAAIDGIEPATRHYPVHADLLETAFDLLRVASSGELVADDDAEPLLLHGIERFHAYAASAPELWIHARARGRDGSPAGWVGDVRVVTAEGSPVADAIGVHLAPPGAPLRRRIVRERFDDWLYDITWQVAERAPAPAPAALLPDAGRWLVFADAAGTGAALAEHMRARGQRVSLVFAGDGYQKLDSERYEVDPLSSASLERLLAAALSDELCPGVIHLWSLDTASGDGACVADLEEAQRIGALSVLLLVQSLLAAPRVGSPRLWLVTRGAQPVVSDGAALVPAQAPLWGLGRTVSLEHPELWGGMVDLDPRGSADEISRLSAEILDPDPQGEEHVALRDGQRWICRLVKGAPGEPRPIPWRPDGAYLITGGLGGIGLQIARWMARQGAHHIVLTGRRAFPERSTWPDIRPESEAAEPIAAIARIEALGASVRVIQADVADEARMTHVLEELAREGLPLRGIMHAAGSSELISLKDLSVDQARSILKPKIAGTWVLHRLTRQRDLDFFVSFSSLSSVLGSSLLGPYAAANHFLDVMARYRRAGGLPALAVSWGAWGQSGLVTSTQHASLSRIGVNVMRPEQASEALGLLLGSDAVHRIVADIEWSKFKPTYELRKRRPLLAEIEDQARARSAGARSAVLDLIAQAPPEERQSIAVTHVKSCVARVFGLDAVDIRDVRESFFAMGMDSLMAVELKNRIEVSFQVSLPATVAFEYPNIVALSGYLIAEVLAIPEEAAPGAPARRPAEEAEEAALAELAGMSEDSLEDLLAMELGELAGS